MLQAKEEETRAPASLSISRRKGAPFPLIMLPKLRRHAQRNLQLGHGPYRP